MVLPHTKARLVIPKPGSKDPRWVIKFYVWNADTGRKQLCRNLECNAITNLADRKKWCRIKIAEINQELLKGWHIDSKKLQALEQERIRSQQRNFMKLSDAIDLVLVQKRGEKIKSIRNYEIALRVFKEWASLIGIQNLSIDSIKRDHITAFMEYISAERDVAGRAYNNYLRHIRHLFKVLIDREIILRNPADKINYRNQTVGRNLAYTVDQQTELIKFMTDKYPNILAFCQVMYYTLMRTGEITNMQAWWIGAYDKNKIYLPKEFSKNGDERHITIPPQLEKIIAKMGWRNLPPDTYLFSSGFRHGTKKMQSRMHANKYRRWVLDKLAFSKDYTMYSWKHTGVVFLYRNDIPRASIRMQAGFRDDKSFEAYLKSLGLFENSLLITSYPSMPEYP